MRRIVKRCLALSLALSAFISCSLNTFAYDGTKAATYAKKWATSRNSQYPNFNANCTNFVSQCVKAGGVTVKKIPSADITYGSLGKVYKSEALWDCQKATKDNTVFGIKINSKTDFIWTSTWSLVSQSTQGYWGFYEHMVTGRGCIQKCFRVKTVEQLNEMLSYCKVGDVMQAWSGGKKYHSVMVTEKTYDSKLRRYNIKIAYNTKDTPPTDFRTVSWAKFGKDNAWTVIRMK